MTATASFTAVPVWYTTSLSAEADVVQSAQREVRSALERSEALFGKKKATISAIWAVFIDHRADDWDGYGAEPVRLAAAELAERFVRSLPDNVPLPEPGAEPDGSLSFDWSRSRFKMLSMSMAAGTGVAYAWIHGDDRGRGVFQFDGKVVPKPVLQRILATIDDE